MTPCRSTGCKSMMPLAHGPNLENIRVVQKVGSGRTKGDVGCDRMVFATNSDLFWFPFDSKFSKWSLDQGQKTINPLIPY